MGLRMRPRAGLRQDERPLETRPGSRRGPSCQHRDSTTRAHHGHERAVSLGKCPVQQAYNTTSTNGRLPTHTTARLGGADSLAHQGKRRRAPASSHGRRCTHNPKVRGSNPLPATKRSPGQPNRRARASSFSGPTSNGSSNARPVDTYLRGAGPKACTSAQASRVSNWTNGQLSEVLASSCNSCLLLAEVVGVSNLVVDVSALRRCVE